MVRIGKLSKVPMGTRMAAPPIAVLHLVSNTKRSAINIAVDDLITMRNKGSGGILLLIFSRNPFLDTGASPEGILIGESCEGILVVALFKLLLLPLLIDPKLGAAWLSIRCSSFESLLDDWSDNSITSFIDGQAKTQKE